MGKKLSKTFVNLIGSYLLMFALFFAISMIVEYFQTRPVDIKANSYLVINLSDTIAESPAALEESIVPDAHTFTLRQVTAALATAAHTPNIKGVILRESPAPDSPLGWAASSELRAALASFKASGKKVYSHSAALDERGLYITSIADDIAMHPNGTVTLNGLAAQVPFFKSALDSLGIKVSVFRRGDYKSFAESFTRTDLSAANRQQLDVLIAAIWDEFCQTLVDERPVDLHQINDIVQNRGLLSAVESLKAKLVDQIAYWPDLKESLSITEDDQIVGLGEFLRNVNHDQPDTVQHIALVYVSGAISADSNYTRIMSALHDLQSDENLRGVVVRIDSPGGAVVPSANIAYQLELLRQKDIPVYVSMGSTAASGGYWIAASSDKIFANPMTMTGSIGVVGIIPNASEGAAKLGVSFDTLSNSPLATLGSPFSELGELGAEALDRQIGQTYDLFLEQVSTHRDLSGEALEAAANARVWTGSDALDKGLVDQLGGLTDTIEAMQTQIGLGELSVEYFPKVERFAKLKQLITGQQASVFGLPLAELSGHIHTIRRSGWLWTISPELFFPLR